MFGHILVPLDGSRLAAHAIPSARALARAFKSRISLLAVIEPMPDRGAVPSAEAAEVDERRIATSHAYLESVAAGIRSPDLGVTTVVRHGNPAEQILAYTEEQGCDLIAMSSHGRTGWERLRLGSVAQHVARHATVPTLVAHPGADAPPSPDGTTVTGVTVTLDGSALAEEALPLGIAIARRLVIPLTLLRVIPTHIYPATTGWDGAYYYPATAEMERAEEREVAAYLAAVSTRVQDSGLEIRTLWRRTPANEADEEIAAQLAQQPMGMAVVASHGRGGVLRWALGSTAEYLLDRAPCPILIVRAGQVRVTETDETTSHGRSVSRVADDGIGVSPSTDAQAELWSPGDIAAERSHPHAITPAHDAR